VVIPDKVSIDLRPDIINQKERFGDWELRSNRRSQIDTVAGPENKGAILTATERTAGFLLMKKLSKGKNAKALAKELFFLLLPYKQCVLSITSDNGSEFYRHKLIAKYLDANCFFCSPIFVMGKRTERIY
jgi:IS30 family transposase